MRVLILGSKGFVGKNISLFLKKNSTHTIINHDRTKCNLANFLETDTYLKKNKPDIIVNLAGKVGGIMSHIGNNYDFLYYNSLISLNLINSIMGIKNCKFLNISSSCAYPLGLKEPFYEKNFLFGNFEPTNEGYAIAKQLTSYLIKYCNEEKNCNFKQIIPSNLYGPYDDFSEQKSHLVASIIKKCHDFNVGISSKISIFGSGRPKRQFLYVEDLAKLVKFYLRNFDSMPSTVNYGSDFNYSVEDYHKKIFKIICGKINKNVFTKNKNYPDGVLSKKISNNKLRDFYKIKNTSFEKSILKTYKYYSNKYYE